MYISPRTSISISLFIFKGIVLIVLTFSVISSPTTPSPLVAPLTNLPFSYIKDTDNPSILSSHTYSGIIPLFLILSSKSLISFSLNTLLKLIIGILCVIFLNSSNTLPPTLLVGESSLAYSGYFSSNKNNSLKYLSYS